MGGVPEVLRTNEDTLAGAPKVNNLSVMGTTAVVSDVPQVGNEGAGSRAESSKVPAAAVALAGGVRRGRSTSARAVCKEVTVAGPQFEALSALVGMPSHQLQLVRGAAPLLTKLDKQGGMLQAVRVDPNPGCHVLVCGYHDGALWHLLKVFRRMRKELGV